MSLEQLRQQLKRDWPAIAKARAEASHAFVRLRNCLAAAAGGSIDSEDVSIVVFGSLARGEWTNGSDLDWTLLIDGQADHGHALSAQHVARMLLKANFKTSGRTGLFGNMAFSPNLIHRIGGQEDSNHNITQRLLLLLESRVVGRGEAHDRVLRGILSRYVANDPKIIRFAVPRFLYNDLDRFWRTMCVDYANKFRDRAGAGWALRHAKLRMSRKLVFVAGLLACFHCANESCKKRDTLWPEDSPSDDILVNELRDYLRRTPLEIVADAAFRFGRPETSARLFDAYNDFLARLDDETIREQMEKLTPEDSEKDRNFQEFQEISREFQEGLKQLFFREDPQLTEFVQEYGVF